MIRPAQDDLDGISLEFFQVGLTYDVSPAIGSYLVATECAEALVDEPSTGASEIRYGFNVNLPPAIAADGCTGDPS